MPDEQIPFEVLGYYEEIVDSETGKCYGTRTCEKPNRPSGYEGRIRMQFKRGERITINKYKGPEEYRFKADADCYIMTHAKCGRMLTK